MVRELEQEHRSALMYMSCSELPHELQAHYSYLGRSSVEVRGFPQKTAVGILRMEVRTYLVSLENSQVGSAPNMCLQTRRFTHDD